MNKKNCFLASRLLQLKSKYSYSTRDWISHSEAHPVPSHAHFLQANQEKLSRMLGSINAMFLMCFRLSKLHEAGKMSHADASMVKAWTTLRGQLSIVMRAHMHPS